jgi:hypothetical protein
MTTPDDLLQSIDSKLTALLALYLDSYLVQTGVARRKDRTIDQLLSDAGLSAATIAGLLGKTDRAVHLQLQNERKAREKQKAARKRKGGAS